MGSSTAGVSRLSSKKMLVLFVKMGAGGVGQKVMIVLFIRENVDNYGQPLS